MHPQKEWKQVLIEIGVPENLTGLIALPVYRKAERPSADALDKAVTWLKTNNRISQTYSEYKNLIDTTFTKTNLHHPLHRPMQSLQRMIINW